MQLPIFDAALHILWCQSAFGVISDVWCVCEWYVSVCEHAKNSPDKRKAQKLFIVHSLSQPDRSHPPVHVRCAYSEYWILLLLSIHIHGNSTLTHLFSHACSLCRSDVQSLYTHTQTHIWFLYAFIQFMISIIHFIFIFSSSIPLDFVFFFLLQFYALWRIRCNISISQCARIVWRSQFAITHHIASWEEPPASLPHEIHEHTTYYISIFSQICEEKKNMKWKRRNIWMHFFFLTASGSYSEIACFLCLICYR